MVMSENRIFGGEHTLMYTEGEIQHCAHGDLVTRVWESLARGWTCQHSAASTSELTLAAEDPR